MVRCAVLGCNSDNNYRYSDGKGGTISFFRFPRENKKFRDIWIAKCGRKRKFNVNTSRVCSMHFRKQDYERNLRAELLDIKNPRRFLKKDAVPSLKLPGHHGERFYDDDDGNEDELEFMRDIEDIVIKQEILPDIEM